ncbi:MAG: hypothetical protein IIC83_10190 [Chloroflexi bacterium]|nr:hypothetical protein [Chloroflexota bacterium]
MQYRAHRIHIVGGSGSGKTTIAIELGRRLDVPTYGLDEIGYEGGAGDRRPWMRGSQTSAPSPRNPDG